MSVGMLICLGIFMSAKTAHRASLIEWLLWCMVCTLLGHIPKLPYLLKNVPVQITIHSSWFGFPKAFGWYCCDYNTNPNFCSDKFNNISVLSLIKF